MTEYRLARAHEEREILDFSNMVFAMTAGPIDFSRVYPSIYGRAGFSRLHIIARDEENRLVSSIAVKPMMLTLGRDDSLSAGYLGTVATHPTERGKGHMKELMRLSIERARADGMELVALGGQRQRYNHYGFEIGAPVITFYLNKDNLKKRPIQEELYFIALSKADKQTADSAYDAYQALVMCAHRSREDFADILRTAGGEGYALMSQEGFEGYVYANGNDIYEYSFSGRQSMDDFARSWLRFRACERFKFTAALHQKETIAQLGAFAESWSLHDDMMIHVLNWSSVLQKLMSFKARHETLRDGEAIVEVKGQAWLRLQVKDNQVSVRDIDAENTKPSISFTPCEAVLRFFSPMGQLQEGEDRFYGWFPLMFSIPRPDWF